MDEEHPLLRFEPKPASTEAIANGCKCEMFEGTILIRKDCPLHMPTASDIDDLLNWMYE